MNQGSRALSDKLWYLNLILEAIGSHGRKSKAGMGSERWPWRLMSGEDPDCGRGGQGGAVWV